MAKGKSLSIEIICMSVILIGICFADSFATDTTKGASLRSPNDSIALRKDSGSVTNEKDSVYLQWHVDKKAQFPGGPDSLKYFIERNFCYPPNWVELQGTVYVRFIVEKDGSISDVKVIRSIESLVDDEAVRVVRSMPKWIPAEKDGKAVRYRSMLPVKF